MLPTPPAPRRLPRLQRLGLIRSTAPLALAGALASGCDSVQEPLAPSAPEAPVLARAPAGRHPPQLAFASDRDGNWEIYRINADGTKLVNLTHNGATDGYSTTGGAAFAWSPDGSMLAYTSDRSGEVEIYLMTADGSPVVRGPVTRGGGVEHDLAWSPDGTVLAFARTAPGATLDDLWTYDRASGAVLARTASGQADEDLPTWSADGSTIAFRHTGYVGSLPCFLFICPPDVVIQVIATIPITGGTPTTLGGGASGTADWPAWSPIPAGSIALVSNADGDDDLYLLQTDGTPPLQLLNRLGQDVGPRWSPDGTRLAFSSPTTGAAGVFQVIAAGPAAGTGLVQLTANGHSPSWAPDGARVAFVRGGILATPTLIRPVSSIYTVPAGGGPETLVVSGPSSHNERPSWRP